MSNDIPKQKKFHLTTFQIIILGFAGVILLGSLLLCLPISTRSGEWASYLDALFTATTSVCVTGLVTQDTGTYWSLFGQIIILILIQIGGMGVMTVAIMLGLMARRRRFSLMQRNTMQEAIGGPSLGNIIKLTKFIISVTAATEIAGAVCMFPVYTGIRGAQKHMVFRFPLRFRILQRGHRPDGRKGAVFLAHLLLRQPRDQSCDLFSDRIRRYRIPDLGRYAPVRHKI